MILVLAFEYKMHTQGIITFHMSFTALNKDDNGCQNKHLAINKAIQRKSQYEDGLQNLPQL